MNLKSVVINKGNVKDEYRLAYLILNTTTKVLWTTTEPLCHPEAPQQLISVSPYTHRYYHH